MKELRDDILKKFLTGECSGQELAEINAFIRESEVNARKLFLIEELYHLGKDSASVTDEYIDRAERKLFKRIDKEEVQRNRRPFIAGWRKYAASILIVLLTGSGLGYWFLSTGPYRNMIVESATGDTVKEILLPDGSKVWLNNGATIKYPDGLDGKERIVHADGEVYFEVAKDPLKPFIVRNDAMRVRVLGTMFNVKSDESCTVAETTLIEGEIEVKGHNNEGMIILAPGQRAELNKSTGRFTVRQVNAKLDAVWRDGLIPFDQADLFAIARTLERFYNVKIILSSDVRSELTYSGVLKKKNTIESVLNSLKNSIPFNYSITGNNVYITPLEK